MSIILSLVLIVVAVPAILSCTYLLVLTLLSRRPKEPTAITASLRFDVIVPAHDEARILPKAIASLRCIDWPADRFRIVVVADNCTDDTAVVAERAGALFLVRNDPTKRGKGYALQYAFEASRLKEWADAVVVVDADSDVSPNILRACAARIATGHEAVQAHYGVRNPMASWRTRLVTIAVTAFMLVRSRARERLGLSCGIRGNGWCVTHKLLARVPYEAFSFAEDIEYGISITVAGYRVAYADEAHANSDMAVRERVARSQRRRWEDGRFQLIRSEAGPLLLTAIRQRSVKCFDVALDLLVLPTSYIALNVLALAILSLAGDRARSSPPIFVWLAVGCVGSLALYVCRGWQLSGIGVQGMWDLIRAPWFVVWKLWLILRSRASAEWIRTKRETG
jgi:cellulose synthase/poly-beta-1,6-N-acetylglucosamine synthase-like glycosyltransferase